MKILFPIILLVFLASCSSDNTEETLSQTETPPSQVQIAEENTSTNEEAEEEQEEEVTPEKEIAEVEPVVIPETTSQKVEVEVEEIVVEEPVEVVETITPTEYKNSNSQTNTSTKSVKTSGAS